jgi:cytochrome c oxidase cbb3-type subunit 1
MWRAVNADGTLTYSFVESLEASKPFYFVRMIGGVFVVAGMILMAYNVYRTIRTPSEEFKHVPQAQAA